MTDEQRLEIVRDTFYDTCCGLFHPDDWEGIEDEFMKVLKEALASKEDCDE